MKRRLPPFRECRHHLDPLLDTAARGTARCLLWSLDYRLERKVASLPRPEPSHQS